MCGKYRAGLEISNYILRLYMGRLSFNVSFVKRAGGTNSGLVLNLFFSRAARGRTHRFNLRFENQRPFYLVFPRDRYLYKLRIYLLNTKYAKILSRYLILLKSFNYKLACVIFFIIRIY